MPPFAENCPEQPILVEFIVRPERCQTEEEEDEEEVGWQDDWEEKCADLQREEWRIRGEEIILEEVADNAITKTDGAEIFGGKAKKEENEEEEYYGSGNEEEEEDYREFTIKQCNTRHDSNWKTWGVGMESLQHQLEYYWNLISSRIPFIYKGQRPIALS